VVIAGVTEALPHPVILSEAGAVCEPPLRAAG